MAWLFDVCCFCCYSVFVGVYLVSCVCVWLWWFLCFVVLLEIGFGLNDYLSCTYCLVCVCGLWDLIVVTQLINSVGV